MSGQNGIQQEKLGIFWLKFDVLAVWWGILRPHISQVNYSPVWPDGGILLVVEVARLKNPFPRRFLAFLKGAAELVVLL